MCGVRFQSRASLTAHRLTHLGRTTCPLCGRVLSRLADVRRHLSMSHGMSRHDARELMLYSQGQDVPPQAGGDPLDIGQMLQQGDDV